MNMEVARRATAAGAGRDLLSAADVLFRIFRHLVRMMPSLLGLGFCRRGHLDPAQAGAVDGPPHQPQCLGLLDELADVGEPVRPGPSGSPSGRGSPRNDPPSVSSVDLCIFHGGSSGVSSLPYSFCESAQPRDLGLQSKT